MPLPKPNESETRDDFVSRCMGNKAMLAETPDKAQRVAVCMSLWRRNKSSKGSVVAESRRPIVAPHQEVTADDLDDLSGWFVVSPPGDVPTSHGGYLMDKEAAEIVLADFKARNNDMVVDYEHQTLGGDFQSPDGKAPAAGWIDKLRWSETRGLEAFIRWTDSAARMIAGGEYRYLSPVLAYDRKTKRVHALLHVGLTNIPAIHNMEPLTQLAASLIGDRNMPKTKKGKQITPHQEDPDAGAGEGAAPTEPTEVSVDDLIAKLAAVLGLDPDLATEEVIAAAIEKLTAKTGEGGGEEITAENLRALQEIAGLHSCGDLGDVITALKGGGADGDSIVALTSRVAVAEKAANAANETLLAMRCVAKVEAAKGEGKLTAAMEEVALSMARKDPATFDKWMEALPVVVPQGEDPSGATMRSGAGGRKAIAMKAAQEWDGNKMLQGVSERDNYVQDAFREKGLKLLTKEELETVPA